MNSNTSWVTATVLDIIVETPTVKTFVLHLPRDVMHLPGQHYEIRLTAPNGYQAVRLYSAASVAEGDDKLALTVALLPGGEVSPYLHNQVEIADQLEVRGPLGKFFVWEPSMTEPVLLIGGGSGVVPMRCILRAHAKANSSAPMVLLYSASTFNEVIYKPELVDSEHTTITLTRNHPKAWSGKLGRIDGKLLQAALSTLPATPLVYICGSNSFVEAMATMLAGLQVPADRIKVERYGGSDIDQ